MQRALRVATTLTRAGGSALGLHRTGSTHLSELRDDPDGRGFEVERPDGATIRGRVSGEGRDVVLVHGYGLGARSWNLVARRLVGLGHRVVAFDLRAHGASTAPDGAVTVRDLAGDLAAVLEQLDVQDAVLAGHSTGGVASIATLVEHPATQERLAGLVLVSTLAGRLLDDEPQEAAGDDTPVGPGVVGRVAQNGSLRLLLSGFVSGLGVSTAVSHELLSEFAATDHTALVSLLRDLAADGYHDRLDEIHLPTLVLYGDDDDTTPGQHARALVEGIPGARGVEVEGAGHLLVWQRPESIVDAVLALHDASEAFAAGDEVDGELRGRVDRRGSALLVLNPASGQHDADETEREVIAALELTGHDVEVRRTEGEGDAREWARRAADAGDVDVLVIAGGDGSVREVVSGVVASDGDVPVVVVPLGTANLLARALGVPTDDPGAAARLAAAGRRRIDVLHLPEDDEHALLMVDGGFDARLVRDASRRVKDVLGAFAYVTAGLRNTVGLDEVELSLEVDGETVTTAAHSVLCLNVGRIGQTVVVDQDIRPDDGLLHVGVVGRAAPWRVLATAVGMVVAGRDAHPNVEWRTCERVRVDASPPLQLQLDGDPHGTTPVELVVLPGAVEVAVPADR